MKTYKVAWLIVSLFVCISCVEDDNFDIPMSLSGITAYPNDQAQFNSINAVLGNFGTGTGDPVTYEAVAEGVLEKYTEGYVVSSDEGGNFYKQLVIQDAPENPTAAIVIQVDKNPMFTQYEFGRKVYVKLNGLAVGESNGVIQLGRLEGGQIARIPSTQVTEYIKRTDEVAAVIAKEVSIVDFSDGLESQYIRLNNMTFADDHMGQTFASENNDSFNGERVMLNCLGNSVILSTSTFSDFKSVTLPENRGSSDGVLTRDFYDDFYTLYINTPEALHFNNLEPCSEALLTAYFTEASDNTNFNFEGWLNSTEEGSESWTEQVYQGNGFAEFSALSSGDSNNTGWLISPVLDLDQGDGEILTFQTEHAYPDVGHDAIKVYISTNFDGTPVGILNATWQTLEFTSSLEANFDNWYTWTGSGDIDLSTFSGQGYIAFVYTGSDTNNLNSTVHLDNVFVTVQ
ncbi:DUF5689 domain-containing protein [Olleya sp. Bg11-27]|uniref:DUF5689 domain-containing protein n=1 Tax=Olleya sp. Bg11-27 TaxID=2058135 RepID=UPI0012FE7746|nr:DUF5689 domain-containing protein [Olleya sp. Bg11-27]